MLSAGLFIAVKPIFYSERHSFLGRSSPGAAWRAIKVLESQNVVQFIWYKVVY